MQTFLIAFSLFGVAILLMASGVILSNRRIKGSCGGLANFKDNQGNSVCDACTSPKPDCAGPDSRSEMEETVTAG